MNNRAPLLCSLVELYPGVLRVTVTIQDPMIKKSDGIGKASLRKGVFISGDCGKRREAYRERERKRASVSSVTAFSTVSMGWTVAFSRKEGSGISFPGWCTGERERLRYGNRVTELETQCDFVIS